MKSFRFRVGIAIWSRLPGRLHVVRALRAIGFPRSGISQDLGFSGAFSLPFQGEHVHFFAEPDDKSAHHLFWHGLGGGWDAVSIKVWAALVKSSQVVLDIGANIGHYALVASKVNPDAEVFAFEPSRRAFEALRRNVALNGPSRIRTASVALSDMNGTALFHDLHSLTAVASLVPDDTLTNHTHATVYEVPVSTLSTYLAQSGVQRVDLVSIDVERHEDAVIRGMGDLLRLNRPNMLVEVLNDDAGTAIAAHFENLGYAFFWIDETRGLWSTSSLRRPSSADSSYNFLICRKESIDVVQPFVVKAAQSGLP